MVSEERFHSGHFPKCILLQAVYWYLRYSLSYRDIEELMKERGVELDHATVQRWVVKYTPLLEFEFRKRQLQSQDKSVKNRAEKFYSLAA